MYYNRLVMAETKNKDSGMMGTSWMYDPNYTPAQNPDYDYKAGIVGTLNASAVTKNGSVPMYSTGAPKDESE